MLLRSGWTPACENHKLSQSQPNVSVSDYRPRKVGAVIENFFASATLPLGRHLVAFFVKKFATDEMGTWGERRGGYR